MSIIKSARLQIEREKNADIVRSHTYGATKAKGPQYAEGEQAWLGEFSDPRETRPHKLIKGDKQPMTAPEQRLFVRTPYERGYLEYSYEGSIRLKESAADDNGRSGSSSAAGAGGGSSSGGAATKSADARDPRRGFREGPGVLRYPFGEQYEGEWRNGRREGEGTLRTPTNYRYVGAWEDDVVSGQGYEMLPSGASYNGLFSHGLPSGHGNFFFTSGQEQQYHYEGPFVDGLRHGEGFIVYPNGDIFKGTWAHGKRHGKGVTTRVVGGKTVQYQTEWEDNRLKGEPRVLDRMKRTKPPRSAAALTNQDAVMPADLTKWTVKEDVEDLSLEHFLRIKLGFEKLDENCGGSLSMGELESIWGKSSLAMLRKLDTDGNGTVELDEIFAGWYPRVPSYTIARFLSQDVSPKTLLRLRGYLGLKVHDHKHGYMQVVGIESIEDVEDRPLTQRQLEATGYRIGGEKFSLAMYEAAKNLTDPPHFAEVLEVCYPNIPRLTLLRYELDTIDSEEIEDLRADFAALTNGETHLRLASILEAQAIFQRRSEAKIVAAREGRAVASYADGDDTEDPERLENQAIDGFFKWHPFWVLGSKNPINLCEPLLRDIDAYDTKVEGAATLAQIVRYCYPNVPCRRSYELLSGKRKGATAKCECCICVNFEGGAFADF